MSIPLQFKLTQIGQAALWNSSNTGTALGLTHVQFGSGNRAPDGSEIKLIKPEQATPIAAGFSVTRTQIRMSAIFSGNQSYEIREVGLWAGDPANAASKLVAYWSQTAGILAYKSAGVDFIFSHDMVLDNATPAGSLTIQADNAQSALLAMLSAHEAKTDPHPQYVTDTDLTNHINAAPLPLAALPFPTIATPSYTLPITANIVNGQGGTVSVPAGIDLALAQDVPSGRAIPIAAITTAWTSPVLAANSTYYLRAQMQNGALLLYVQQGSDSDAMPANQKGSPNASSGGGFDSTVLDILLAKVVSGAVGTLPSVTALKNKNRLAAFYNGSLNSTDSSFDSYMNMTGSIVQTLNWARTPTIDHVSRISDGARPWQAVYTDWLSIKTDTNLSNLSFDKNYVRNRYLSKIPIHISLSGGGTATPDWFKFEVLILE